MTNAPHDDGKAVNRHLLELSQASAHLRAVARAWAEGEVPRDDYRTIRGMTLEAMIEGAPPDAVMARVPPLAQTAAGAKGLSTDATSTDATTLIGPHLAADNDVTGPNPGLGGIESPDRPAGRDYVMIAGLAILVVLGIAIALAVT